MHEPAADTPLTLEKLSVPIVVRVLRRQEFQRNASAGLTVIREPRNRGCPGAQAPQQCIPAGELRTFFEDPHKRFAGNYPVGC
jgi:hypothetical protein